MRSRVTFVLILLVLFGSLAWVMVRAQEIPPRLLVDRYASRMTSGAAFISRFVRDRSAEELRIAETRFSGPATFADDFDLAVEALGFEAAVLLDQEGRLLQVYPRAPQLLGDEIASKYAHLASALAGKPAISSIVPSAARGEPVVGIAVPYETPFGRRVFSGAFSVEVGPLGTFLDNMLPFGSAVAYLVDGSGNIAATSEEPRNTVTPFEVVEPELSARLALTPRPARANGQIQLHGAPRRYSSEHVVGTDWTLISHVEESDLFGPIAGTSLPQWVVFATLVAAAAAASVLLLRLETSTKQLEQRVSEQERLNRALEDFSGRAAHDLRSPLAGMQMAVDLLSLEDLPADKRSEVTGALRNQTQKATTLIDDLLGLARASGTARRERIETGPFIDEIVAEVPEVEVTVGELPRFVTADPVSVRQALLNFLRNASKYAVTNGRAAVDLTVIREAGGTTFTVADRGPGIPAEHRDRLFEPFNRGGTKSIAGTGLGLAIVGATAEAHGGRAWYEERPGGGARFNLQIPDAPRAKRPGR